MSIIMLAGALALILAIGGHWLWRNGYQHGHGKGMLAGHKLGVAEGDAGGYARAQMDAARAKDALAEHNDQMLRMIRPPVQDEDIQRLIDGIPGVAEVLRSVEGCGAALDQEATS